MNNFTGILNINNEARGRRGASGSRDFDCLGLHGVLPERAGVPFSSPLEGLASCSVHFLRLLSYVWNNISGSQG